MFVLHNILVVKQEWTILNPVSDVNVMLVAYYQAFILTVLLIQTNNFYSPWHTKPIHPS